MATTSAATTTTTTTTTESAHVATPAAEARAPAVKTPSAADMVHVIKDSSLFVSEPNPAWFGNEPNPSKGEGENWNNENWLKSRFHFNFAEYRSGPSNFGPLRVCNDDLVQPHRGFGEHPHANAEIVTLVVDGDLTHKDSMGTAETLTTGDVQFMTAGRGVRHSEHNRSDKPLRFIQMWFLPRQGGLTPNYGSMRGNAQQRHNRWHHIVTDTRNTESDIPIKIHQDVNLFVTDLDKGKTLPLSVEPGRKAYFLCLNGADVQLGEGIAVSTHDSAQIKGGSELLIHAGNSSAQLLLIDVVDRM